MHSYSLNELDIKLLKYINKRNGFFIEVGANNGISQTNTLLFEKNYGWNGMLIEAIPDLSIAVLHKNEDYSDVLYGRLDEKI